MERCRRFILVLAAALALTPLVIKGGGPIRMDGAAPFLPFSTTGIKVRLEGGVRSPGVYSFPPGANLASVIKLTAVSPSIDTTVLPLSAMPVPDGAILDISPEAAKPPEIGMKTMRARERVLLGIPLDPDLMDSEDWLSLPGIGPALAERIVRYRQEYGEFHTLTTLKNVPGIGDKRYAALEKYF